MKDENVIEDLNFKVSKSEFNPILTLRPQPVHIQFHDTKTNDVIGKFFEVEGKMEFEGDVTESAKVFVDFVCETFNQRISELKTL